jgi:hypothetical protein
MNILNEVLALWTINELSIDDGLLLSFGSWKRDLLGNYAYLNYYDEPIVYIQCSDRFYWATADYEQIQTPEDIELLRVTIEDCRNEIDGNWGDTEDVCVVYCARKRNLQPMPRYMKDVVGELCKDLPVNTVWH